MAHFVLIQVFTLWALIQKGFHVNAAIDYFFTSLHLTIGKEQGFHYQMTERSSLSALAYTSTLMYTYLCMKQ